MTHTRKRAPVGPSDEGQFHYIFNYGVHLRRGYAGALNIHGTGSALVMAIHPRTAAASTRPVLPHPARAERTVPLMLRQISSEIDVIKWIMNVGYYYVQRI